MTRYQRLGITFGVISDKEDKVMSKENKRIAKAAFNDAGMKVYQKDMKEATFAS